MKLDRTDVEILRALQQDARLSFRDLSRRIGVSVPTVSARVANLRDLGIITGFHAAVDPQKLREVRVVIIARCAPRRADEVGAAFARFPEVRWTVRTEGSRVVAEAILPRAASLRSFLAKVQTLPGIRSYEHHVAAKGLKDAPRAVISDDASAAVECFECGQLIEGDPIRIRLDGRSHYVCCPSCERLYRERYARIRSAAGATGLPRASRRVARSSPSG